MAGKDWLITDVNRLRALYESGASMDEIAKAFPGRTRKAVQESLPSYDAAGMPAAVAARPVCISLISSIWSASKFTAARNC